jgi:hypothetical protein
MISDTSVREDLSVIGITPEDYVKALQEEPAILSAKYADGMFEVATIEGVKKFSFALREVCNA